MQAIQVVDQSLGTSSTSEKQVNVIETSREEGNVNDRSFPEFRCCMRSWKSALSRLLAQPKTWVNYKYISADPFEQERPANIANQRLVIGSQLQLTLKVEYQSTTTLLSSTPIDLYTTSALCTHLRVLQLSIHCH